MAVVMTLCLVGLAGCGSAASTSRTEVRLVALAEREFTTAYGRANGYSRNRCEAKTASDAAFTHCFAAEVRPGEQAAEAKFSQAVDKVLAAGVGSECAEALEAAVAEAFEIPLFPDEATEACRAESRDG
jgi:hypothetical protein